MTKGRTLPNKLVLLRHGQSTWNLENLFTGWVDVGPEPARRAGGGAGRAAAGRAGMLPRRAAHLAADPGDPHRRLALRGGATGRGSRCGRSWRLNERHYGALQGKNKKETAEEFGEEKLLEWRRVVRRPAAAVGVGRGGGDPRYADLPPEVDPEVGVPGRRRRADDSVLVGRDRARPRTRPGRARRRARQLAARAGEAPRRAQRRGDLELNIRTGNPLVYELDSSFAAVSHRYLDPEAALPPPPTRWRSRPPASRKGLGAAPGLRQEPDEARQEERGDEDPARTAG